MPNVTQVSPQELRSAVAQLAAVGDAELAALLARSEARSFGDGENLFFEGQPAHALYFLVRGSVRIHRKLESGAQVDLAVLEHGAIFGEVALLAQTERTASASAQGPVVVVRVPPEVLQADYEAGRRYAQTLLLAVARVLAGRLEAMNRRLLGLITQQSRGGELDDFRKKMFQDWTS